MVEVSILTQILLEYCSRMQVYMVTLEWHGCSGSYPALDLQNLNHFRTQSLKEVLTSFQHSLLVVVEPVCRLATEGTYDQDVAQQIEDLMEEVIRIVGDSIQLVDVVLG